MTNNQKVIGIGLIGLVVGIFITYSVISKPQQVIVQGTSPQVQSQETLQSAQSIQSILELVSQNQKLIKQVLENLGSQAVQAVQNLGGTVENFPTQFINGLKAGLTNQFTIDKSGNVTTSGNLTASGTTNAIGGITGVVSTGTFADATTTLGCVANPTTTTSTLDFVKVTLTGMSTSSFSLVAATSTATTGLTTSTLGFGIISTLPTTQVLNLNLVSSGAATSSIYYGAGVADNRSSQGQQVAKSIQVSPTENVCFVAGEGNGGSTAGITSGNNLFAGTYLLHWTY